MGSMRPTVGDEVLESVLAKSKTARDVLKGFADNPKIVERVQAAMDRFKAKPPKQTGSEAEEIRTALVQVLSEEFA